MDDILLADSDADTLEKIFEVKTIIAMLGITNYSSKNTKRRFF